MWYCNSSHCGFTRNWPYRGDILKFAKRFTSFERVTSISKFIIWKWCLKVNRVGRLATIRKKSEALGLKTKRGAPRNFEVGQCSFRSRFIKSSTKPRMSSFFSKEYLWSGNWTARCYGGDRISSVAASLGVSSEMKYRKSLCYLAECIWGLSDTHLQVCCRSYTISFHQKPAWFLLFGPR